jgi:hypothetical protein
MPWEETDEFIRSGHRSPSEFQDGSFRTIWISESEGIKAIIGKPKGKTTTEVQSYLFLKEKGWTMEKAKNWFREHYKAEAESGVELTFMAAIHSIASQGDHLATFYVMNTSLNRNRWKVTDEALEAALPSLLGKILGCIPGYRVNHVHKPLDVGKWVKVEKPDGYALATAEITDPVAWSKLTSGEWGPVSVVISAYRVVCSKCGEDITAKPCEHIASGEAFEIVESFKFDRVDFVGTPAYPQAGIVTLDELKEAQAARARMASYSAFAKAPEDTPWDFNEADYDLEQLKRASAYVEPPGDKKGDCHLAHHKPDGILVWHGVSAAGAALQGSRGGYQGPGKDQAKEHLTPHYHAFEKEAPWEQKTSQSTNGRASGSPGENPNPEEERKKGMESKIAELESKVNSLTTENTSLKASLKSIRDEQHDELVAAAVDARVKAGLMKAENADKLKPLDDETLRLLKADAEAIVKKLQAAPKKNPKTSYDDQTPEEDNSLKAAIDESRTRLFGKKEANK